MLGPALGATADATRGDQGGEGGGKRDPHAVARTEVLGTPNQLDHHHGDRERREPEVG